MFLVTQSRGVVLISGAMASGECVCLLGVCGDWYILLSQRSTAPLCKAAERLAPSLHGCLNTAAGGECLERRLVCAIELRCCYQAGCAGVCSALHRA